MISPDKLERYKDFMDPKRLGSPYDPRQGLERLMGVLSPDPKGMVLAAMGYDWYGNSSQLQNSVLAWLEERGLPKGIWPITRSPTWWYCEQINRDEEILDGSLVDLGAVVKKAEDPLQVLYSRSAAGAELAVPLVQQAVEFVSRATEYTERQKLKGQIPHKFNSMWRVIGAVNSKTDQRRPLAVWEIIDFLYHNRGKHRQIDVQNQTHISQARLGKIIQSLGNSGIIDYKSPQIEVEGQRGRGWAGFRLNNQQSVIDLDSNSVYRRIKDIRKDFEYPTYLSRIIDYMKKHPNGEYEYHVLAEELGVSPTYVSRILTLLGNLGLLSRLNPSFKDRTVMAVSANDLTFLFYDLVCAPAKDVADTLSSLPLQPWDRSKVAIYLKNYNEERSHIGSQAGKEVRSLLLDILSEGREEMKLSHIIDLYNNRAEIELSAPAIIGQLQNLLKAGKIQKPRLRYYKLVQK